MIFLRITIDSAVCSGKPWIMGLRFPVARLIDEALRCAAQLADGETIEFAQ
jgi:uncharacterized protein (DUF433 family)